MRVWVWVFVFVSAHEWILHLIAGVLVVVSILMMVLLSLSSLLFIIQGGYYYGKIKFPPEYPFKPPGIRYFCVLSVMALRELHAWVLLMSWFHHAFVDSLFNNSAYLLYSMTTPNGRFMTQKKICLSMSDCKLLGVLLTCQFLILSQ